MADNPEGEEGSGCAASVTCAGFSSARDSSAMHGASGPVANWPPSVTLIEVASRCKDWIHSTHGGGRDQIDDGNSPLATPWPKESSGKTRLKHGQVSKPSGEKAPAADGIYDAMHDMGSLFQADKDHVTHELELDEPVSFTPRSESGGTDCSKTLTPTGKYELRRWNMANVPCGRRTAKPREGYGQPVNVVLDDFRRPLICKAQRSRWNEITAAPSSRACKVSLQKRNLGMSDNEDSTFVITVHASRGVLAATTKNFAALHEAV
ncbi:hypothetical protein EDD16DRAFT_1728817 [Pisolithus croceorrhizus]|nr:hypothetical protein EDD16DRAFT_1728817 [Pisolithus croceorrhizus]KAI6120557.1 hypothetical protein EV401DRAFT_1887553 [Pisolithus croceorrhizus]KAI6138755.1 hypothetical protein EDD17DRAFT_1903032 [Pisolithus thermaeus]